MSSYDFYCLGLEDYDFFFFFFKKKSVNNEKNKKLSFPANGEGTKSCGGPLSPPLTIIWGYLCQKKKKKNKWKAKCRT
jgi:hypothetical protein